MAVNEIKKMKKPEILRHMLRQQRRIEQLREELSDARKQLAQRQESIRHAGTIADAAIASGSLFEEARKAADLYVKNVQGAKSRGDAPIQSNIALEHLNNPDSRETTDFPDSTLLEQVIRKDHYHNRYVWIIRNTIYAFVTLAAIAILLAVLILPVLQIYGTSMNPTLREGEIVIAVKGSSLETGDIAAFYYNNNILVKRVIGTPGQTIDIQEDGTVLLDNEAIEEPYLSGKELGECDIELPYQVPESRIFVMGDNRGTSIDSRSRTIGCIAEEQMVGKVVFRIWPLSSFGGVG